MTRTEFTDQMNKLLIFYREPAKEANEYYWSALHDTSAATFEKACDIILDTHKVLGFPLIPVFHEAIIQASRESGPSDSTILSINCPYCKGIGLTLEDDKSKRSVAHPCSCSKGQIYKASFDRVRIKAEIQQRELVRDKDNNSSADPY